MSFTRSLFALCLVAAASTPVVVNAQQVFRIVGPDGRVTFSDKPPAEPLAKSSTQGAQQSGPASGGVLPFELRQVVGKYPVTLYTGTNCGPCGAGKAFLMSRGVPFAEKTITTNEDIDALTRLASDASLPLLTVGSQQLKGYSDTEWSQFLDAAGYPKTSQLPASYRQAPPAPLVALQRQASPSAAAAATAEPVRPAVVTPPSAPSNTSNPAGIRF